MASSSWFFVVTSADRQLHADVAKDLDVAMFNLKDRPLDTRKGLVLFDRLVYSKEFPTIRRAQVFLRKFERLSHKKKLALIEDQNPTWKDQSGTWFPVTAASGAEFNVFGDDSGGESAGGIGAKLIPRVPPRVAEDAVDPLSVMALEELIEAGIYAKVDASGQKVVHH